ncbi:unnamed protein product, partial [Ectocarpus fasciculatus]
SRPSAGVNISSTPSSGAECRRMPLLSSPLPQLRVEPQSPQGRRNSNEFGWFDIEPLLTSRTASFHSGFWDSENGEGVLLQEPTACRQDNSSALPRALERVFCWLEEVEAGCHGASGVDETIINTDALVSLRAPRSPSRRDSDKVVTSCAVTKADFSVASRDQPSLAIGIYAHRVVCRSRWLFWSESYAEYLVVTGTETELLRAWRSYPDFYSLVETVRALRAHGAADVWDRLDQALGPHRRTDPEGLRTEARVLGRFLTTVLEELTHSDVGVLADFVREPTTYLVVGVEDIASDESERHGEPPASAPEALENTDSVHGVESCGRLISCPPADRMLGAKVGHPMKWETRESLLPTPRSLVGM